jgi:hypothetical protein
MKAKEIIKFVREVKAGVEALRATAKSDFELSCIEFLEADDFNQDMDRDEDDEGEQDDVDKWRICFVHEDGVTEQLEFPCSDYTSDRTVEMIKRCVKIFD